MPESRSKVVMNRITEKSNDRCRYNSPETYIIQLSIKENLMGTSYGEPGLPGGIIDTSDNKEW